MMAMPATSLSRDFSSRCESWCAQGLPFVEALEARRKAAAERLTALLGAGLAAALRQGNASARQLCLQAYAAVGDAAGAEQARWAVSVELLWVLGCMCGVLLPWAMRPARNRYAGLCLWNRFVFWGVCVFPG